MHRLAGNPDCADSFSAHNSALRGPGLQAFCRFLESGMRQTESAAKISAWGRTGYFGKGCNRGSFRNGAPSSSARAPLTARMIFFGPGR